MKNVNEQMIPRSLLREVNRKILGRKIIRWEQVHEKWLVFLEGSILIAKPFHNPNEEYWVVEEYSLEAPQPMADLYAERVLARG